MLELHFPRRRLVPLGRIALITAVTAALASGCTSKKQASDLPRFNVSTLAGLVAERGDGGPAAKAELIGPSGLATAQNGAVFIADDIHNVIRRVEPDGTIRTVAGTGDIGFDGEGAPGLVARLNQPQQMAVDATGNLYFADTGNGRIRKLSTDGIISTVAGTGVMGPEGDGLTATAAQLFLPIAVAVGPRGDVLIADTQNRRIRRVDTTGAILPFAGTGEPSGNVIDGEGGPANQAKLGEPTGVLVRGDGSVIFADRVAGAIRRVAPDGTISTLAAVKGQPGAPGGAAVLGGRPYAIADTPKGLAVVEPLERRVELVVGSTVSLIAEGKADGGGLGQPRAIAAKPDGTLLVADGANRRVVALRPNDQAASGGVTGANPSTVIAGEGSVALGNGGPATNATVLLVSGIAVAKTGELYIADKLANQIRRVGRDGTITAVAGVGVAGFSGDGGPAAKARLSAPEAVAIDAQGRILIADAGNLRLRRIDEKGTISTIAGNGTTTPALEDALAAESSVLPGAIAIAPNGTIYVAEPPLSRVIRIDPQGKRRTVLGRDTDVTKLLDPQGIAVDPNGSVFVTDATGNRVFRVTAEGEVSTFIGNGTAGYAEGRGEEALVSSPQAVVAFDVNSLLFADYGNNVIRSATPNGTSLEMGTGAPGVTGDGRGPKEVAIGGPTALGLDPNKTLYVAQPEYRVIRAMSSPDFALRTVAGVGRKRPINDGQLATRARLSSPVAMAVNSRGEVVVADVGHNRVRRIDAKGTITTLAGTGSPGFNGDGIEASRATLSSPNGVAFAPNGDVLIADTENHRVRRIGPDGKITTIAGTNESGTTGDGGPAIKAQLARPVSVAFDRAGNLFVADAGNGNLRRIDPKGTISTIATDLGRPAGIAVTATGDILVAEEGAARVTKVSSDGKTKSSIAGNGKPGFTGDGGPALKAQLGSPVGVAVGKDGDIYVADAVNARIRRVDAAGRIATIAGSGTPGGDGDGGTSLDAQFLLPAGLAFAANGDLLVADSFNNRVRRLRPA